MQDPEGDKDGAPFTEPVLPGMEGVESTATADDETVVDPDAPDAPAQTDEQAQDDDQAQPDATAEVATLTKNYKSVQAWATKVSQENAAMRAELEALRGGQAQERQPAEPEPSDNYDWNEFNRIADEKGREAAFEHRDAHVEKRILSRIEARERAQSRQGRVESEVVRLAKLAEIKDTDYEVLEQLRQGETALGFEPSPGALLALRLGGGSWDKVIAALKGRGAAPAAAPAQRKVHPGLPGGHGERAPAKSASRNAGKLSARQAGF